MNIVERKIGSCKFPFTIGSNVSKAMRENMCGSGYKNRVILHMLHKWTKSKQSFHEKSQVDILKDTDYQVLQISPMIHTLTVFLKPTLPKTYRAIANEDLQVYYSLMSSD